MSPVQAKYVLILPDGAADEPVTELGGRTPLEVARKPHMDWIAANGRQGTVATVPEGFDPGSDVATMSILGYDPRRYHTGRAPLEAVARRIPLARDELVFRCNLVTIADGRMIDYAAGHIGQAEAERLICELNSRFERRGARFHAGVSYRHLMVLADAGGQRPQCTPPHDIPGQSVRPHLPRGRGSRVLRRIMQEAESVLARHEINLIRRDLGENPANALWLWGAGRGPRLPRFRDRFRLRGAAVAAVDLIRGLAICLGWQVLDVSGATGYLDTDYDAKGRAAVAALEEYDLVVVHVEAPDEAGHQGDAPAKVRAIERIDAGIVGPVLSKLRSFDRWRIGIAPDHPTPVTTRVHSRIPPPFCMAGTGVPALGGGPFSEALAAASDLHVEPGHNLMEYFLRIT